MRRYGAQLGMLESMKIPASGRMRGFLFREVAGTFGAGSYFAGLICGGWIVT